MFNYEYKLILALGNKQIDIAMLEPFFEEARKDFNDYSITLIKNKKYIRDFHIDRDKNTLIIYLQSEKKLPIAVRGLRYYTQIIISRMGSNNEKFGELTGKEVLEKIINKNNNHNLAYCKIKNVTFWVEYTIEDGKYLVYNAYSHRMNIEVD